MAKREQAQVEAGEGDGARDVGELSYEEAVAALEEIIDRIESGEIGLEASIAAYERGLLLKKRCEAILEAAEQRIDHLRGGDAQADA